MQKNELIVESALLISNDLGLEPFDLVSLTKSLLLTTVTKAVQHWIDTDLGHLLNVLYRIDIPEEDVKSILSSAPPDEISQLIASKIIDRQYEKAKTRLRYRSGSL